MDGFDLDMWASSSIVDGGSAPGLGGPGQGTSLTRVTSEGTSGGGVVVNARSRLFVNTAADQTECRLVRLQGSALDESELCGGDIGRAGQRMCVVRSEECTVTSHKARPARWKPDDLSPSDVYVFITVAGTMAKVWTDSAMPFETIEPVWTRVKEEERTMSDWMALFNKIKSGDLSPAELVGIVDAHADSDEALGRTAASPRHRNAEEDPEVDWDAIQESEEAFTNAEEEETVARVSGDVQDRLRELSRAVRVTRSQQRDTDLRQAQLQNQVGIRSPRDGAASVHTAVTRLEDRLEVVEDTTEAVHDQVDALVRSGDLEWMQRLRREDVNLGQLRIDMTKKLTDMLTRNVGPMIQFFSAYTTKEPGDGLRDILRTTGDRLNRVEADMFTLKPTGSAGRGWLQGRVGQVAAPGQEESFGLNMFDSAVGARPSAGIARSSGIGDRDTAARIVVLEERCALLLENYTRVQSQVKNLQEENKESSVEVAGKIFCAMSEFVPYFTDDAQGLEEHVGISDVMALLVSTGANRDSMEVVAKLKEHSESKKAGFESADGAYYVASFSCSCPDQFRKSSDRDGIDMNSQLLTRFPKFEKFDQRTGGDSVKGLILKRVQDRVKQLIASHRSLPSKKLFEIKREVLDGSYRFLEKLFTWMTTHYRDQVADQGPKSEGEVWLYIQHSVRAIFQALYEVRHFGADRTPAEQAWYALRGYALQEEIMAAEFENHDIVLRVLHQHLKNNVVTKTQFAEEVADLKALILKGKGKAK